MYLYMKNILVGLIFQLCYFPNTEAITRPPLKFIFQVKYFSSVSFLRQSNI